ncbi:hypothetical protein ACWGE1_06565 [Streptomyces sp. NPDC054932]
MSTAPQQYPSTDGARRCEGRSPGQQLPVGARGAAGKLHGRVAAAEVSDRCAHAGMVEHSVYRSPRIS